MKFNGLNKKSLAIDVADTEAQSCYNCNLETALEYMAPPTNFTNPVYFQGKLYEIDATGIIKEDGVTLGVAAPDSNPTMTSTNSSGSVATGDYDFILNYLDTRGYEGSESAKGSVTVTGSTNYVTINWKTSDVPTGASVKLWVRGGSAYVSDYVLLDTVVPTDTQYSNGSYIWSNGVIDPGNGIFTAGDNDVPATATNGVLCFYNQMLFVATGNQVIYSRVGFDVLNGFPARNKLTFSDTVTGLAVIRETLAVSTQYGIYNVTGQDFDSIDIHETSVKNGCTRRNTFLPVKGNILYVGHDGVYEFNGMSETKISEKVDSLFSSIAASVKAVWTNNYYHLDNGISIDAERGNWLQFTNGITGWRYKTKSYLHSGLPVREPTRIIVEHSNPVTARVYHDDTAVFSNQFTTTTRAVEMIWLPQGWMERVAIEFDGDTNARLYFWALKGIDA